MVEVQLDAAQAVAAQRADLAEVVVARRVASKLDVPLGDLAEMAAPADEQAASFPVLELMAGSQVWVALQANDWELRPVGWVV